LTIDGVDFTLIDAGIESSDALAFYCDFGLPPAKNRLAVLERLLKMNLSLHGINTPLFALNPETGHVLLARRIPLGKISALELMDMLAEYAAHAKEWRQTYYLDTPAKLSQTKHAGSNRRMFEAAMPDPSRRASVNS
jgi:hypothetical protein